MCVNVYVCVDVRGFYGRLYILFLCFSMHNVDGIELGTAAVIHRYKYYIDIRVSRFYIDMCLLNQTLFLFVAKS